MNRSEKLIIMAENVPKVYDAGYEKGKAAGGGVTSWNDLTDKPFGSTFEFVELASATSAVSYDAEAVQYSCSVSLDFTPIDGQMYKLVATDGTQTVEAEQVCMVVSIPSMNMYSAFIGTDITDNSRIYMKKMVATSPWSVYFKATSEEGAMWTITVYEISEIVTTLDSKYLPDGIPFVASASVGQAIAVKAVNEGKPTEFEAVNLVKSYSDLTDAPMGERVTTIIGERTIDFSMSLSTSLGNFSLTGCNLVRFDGVEYEVSPYAYAAEMLYGNPALRKTGLLYIDMPFVLADVSAVAVTLQVSEPGTHTISAYKRESVLLDEKYIPDTIARTSDVYNKIEVDEKIANAGGVTSWNDLEDKPFGEEEDYVEIWSELVFDIHETNILSAPSTPLTEGDRCRYIYDGVVYETQITRVASDGGKHYLLIGGNPHIRQGNLPDNGQPVVFWYYSLNKTYFVDGNALFGTHTFSAEKLAVVARTIDEKYIPNTIARVSDIPTLEEFIAALPIYNGEVIEE